MRNVNANVDSMREFVRDLKNFKEQNSMKKREMIQKLNNLNHSWKDKAYENYKENFLRELNMIQKNENEFIETKIKEIEQKANELEIFLDKMNR
jgi:hypothetical protein